MDPEHIEKSPVLYMSLTAEQLRSAMHQRDDQIMKALAENKELKEKLNITLIQLAGAKVSKDFANLACEKLEARIQQVEAQAAGMKEALRKLAGWFQHASADEFKNVEESDADNAIKIINDACRNDFLAITPTGEKQ